MKRSKVTEEYVFYTGKASDVVRQLALGGFALMWVFKKDSGVGPVVPQAFLWPALFLLAALGADFLQYSFGAGFWGWYDESLTRAKTDDEADVKPPDRLYYPSRFCFYLKLIALAVGYIWLLIAVARNNKVFGDAPPPAGVGTGQPAAPRPGDSAPASSPAKSALDSTKRTPNGRGS